MLCHLEEALQELLAATSSVLVMIPCVHAGSWAQETHLSTFLHILGRYGKGQTPLLMSSDAHRRCPSNCVLTLGTWLAYVPESPVQVVSIPFGAEGGGTTFLVPLHRWEH